MFHSDNSAYRDLMSYALIVLMALATLLSPTPAAAASCPVNADFALVSRINDAVTASVEPSALLTLRNTHGLNFRYADRPARWLMNGQRLDPAWQWVYDVELYRRGLYAGELWIATLASYPDAYFGFVFPVAVIDGGETYSDHPCRYWSADRATVSRHLSLPCELRP